VLEPSADRSERVLQILEGLHRLQPDVAAELAVTVDPELTGDVNDPRRRGGLDNVSIAGRFPEGLGVDETGLAHGIVLLAPTGSMLRRLGTVGRDVVARIACDLPSP
jgi:hypothetical protein